MPLLEDNGSMDIPNLDLRESGSCAMDGEADILKPALSSERVFCI